ncbi:MAG: nucleotidyltransferase domain-containing protein [Thiocapsa sp.]|uniref:nucleotidyltransferase domain-containing protein n=1 Tax=Thiocapsa sp. TaxID=2024551 RepID=UPI001BD0ED2F|nr:nucleotidyltransferase domain-containing protein [Thiocapsa sp.]QVL50100.1 MAG: nucleotidyltransferase domain-containing protein [Thiocapsa sp.]
MRLTERQREVIREAGLRHFGAVPWLFGSRLNDAGRGGDIDLYIPGDWSAEASVPRRMRFCMELRQGLGDQKIDVVVGNRSQSSIQSHAQATGVPV